MPKIALTLLAIAFLIIPFSTALKCHYCLEACEASKATSKTCGDSIGSLQEAVCTREIPKGKSDNMAIRKCQIVKKGEDVGCPENSKCYTCRTELCNTAHSIYGNVGLLGGIVAVIVGKYLIQ